MDAHEELAHLGKFADESGIFSDELLDRLVVTEVAEVTEDRHEPLGLERKTVNVQLRNLRCVSRSIEDTFFYDLVCEEVDDVVE